MPRLLDLFFHAIGPVIRAERRHRLAKAAASIEGRRYCARHVLTGRSTE